MSTQLQVDTCTTQSEQLDGRARRRKHEPAFEAAVVAACSRPGVSIAAVALHNRLNANLLRRWVAQAGIAEGDGAIEDANAREIESTAPISGFVPVRIEPPLSKTTIDVEVRRGATVVRTLRRIGPARSLQGLGPELAHRAFDLLQLSLPYAHRLPRYAVSSRHLGLRHFAFEQSCALDTPRLDRFQIPLRRHTTPSPCRAQSSTNDLSTSTIISATSRTSSSIATFVSWRARCGLWSAWRR